MMDILRDHESGICMHGGFETTASMVSRIGVSRIGVSRIGVSRVGAAGEGEHWFTGRPHPCRSPFERVPVAEPSVATTLERVAPAGR
jgi:hypothetical protein